MKTVSNKMAGLPSVHPAVAASVSKVFEEFDDDDAFVEAELKRLGEANPVLAQFITNYIEKIGLDENAAKHFLVGSIVVYLLLESQAEVNQMHQEIRGFK